MYSKPYVVNLHYEKQLAGDKNIWVKDCAYLEFLYFFLETRPLLTKKKYSSHYLSYVESLVGHRPQFVNESNDVDFWWGKLLDIDYESEINSKISAQIKFSPSKDFFLVYSLEEIEEKLSIGPIVLKWNFNYSGRGIYFVKNKAELHENVYPFIKEHLKNGMYLEYLRNRLFDFSTYFFETGERIYYQNKIDVNGSFHGSIFNDLSNPDISSLSFHSLISQKIWKEYQFFGENLKKNINLYQGFSVDSFIYQLDKINYLKPMCEINFRQTMGSVTYQICHQLKGDCKYGELFLLKSQKKVNCSFDNIYHLLLPILKLDNQEGFIILSPGDVRFEMLLLITKDNFKAIWFKEELNKLLLNTHLAISF